VPFGLFLVVNKQKEKVSELAESVSSHVRRVVGHVTQR
jgi:hypothetical protein